MRISLNEYFKKFAQLTSERSTCAKVRVGAVLIKNKKIISIGYNGVNSGQKHCEDYFKEVFVKFYNDQFSTYEDFLLSKRFSDLHAEFSELNEQHAEVNCLISAAKNGNSTSDCDLYLTLSPCMSCSKIIFTAGIKNVFYIKEYDRDIRGIKFLNENGVKCEKMEG